MEPAGEHSPNRSIPRRHLHLRSSNTGHGKDVEYKENMNGSYYMGVKGLAAALLLVLSAWPSPGQQAQPGSGSLRGRVTDERGGLIPGADVMLSGAGGPVRTTTTDREGVYYFVGLAAGVYILRAKAGGFAPYEQAGVLVSAGQGAVLDLVLPIELEKQEVTVEAGSPVSTMPEANANAIVLRGAELDALPDDPEALAATLQALAGPASGPDGGQIFIDGFTAARLPSKTSIREVRINQNPFSAEFDRLGFGRIEIITKAGASKYEGGAFFSFNDESLNARSPLSPTRAPFQVRRYGGYLSGPFLSKRGSFFLDFEQRETDDNAVVNATVLDAALDVGHFNQVVLAPQRRGALSLRLDRQLGANNTLVVRYTRTNSKTENAGVGDFSLLSRAYEVSGGGHNLQVTQNSVIGQRFVNDIRFQIARESRRLGSDNTEPGLIVLDAFAAGGPQVGSAHHVTSRYELGDSLMFARGGHTYRVGARLRGVSVTDVSPQNFGGTFTYAGGLAPLLVDGHVILNSDGTPVLEAVTSIERFRRTQVLRGAGLTPAEIRLLGGGATQFSISSGDARASVSQHDLGAFVQDDWRIRPNLMVNLGLRYETQTNIAAGFNLAPRLALAWAPVAAANGRARTVLRAGLGVFYSRFSESLTLQARRFDGSRLRQFIVSDPAVIDLLADAPSAGVISDLALPPTVSRVAEDLIAPYSIQSVFSVEQQLPRSSTLTINFLSLRTLHVLRTRNVNAPLPGTTAPAARPLPGVGNVYLYESSGNFNMSRLEVLFATRFSRKVTLNAVYGLGRARSDSDGVNTFPADSYDLGGEYGAASLDIRHRFFLTGSISAPWGLRLSPMIVASSGRPFNITTGRDTNGDTLFTERPAFANDLAKPGVVVTPFGAFDLNPGLGQEIIPRNYGRGPDFFAISLRVGRTFRFGAAEGGAGASGAATRSPQPARAGQGGDRATAPPRYSLNLSVQAWNLFNRANLNVPVGNLSSPMFGRSNLPAGSFGSGDPLSGSRVIELQVRLGF
jgi:hypothetical protein